MSTTPSGRLSAAGEGSELVLTRVFRAPADDVWRSVTEPERTARWFGPREGEAGPGWEYYLDMPAASREGRALPDFDDYYPAQKPCFEGLARR